MSKPTLDPFQVHKCVNCEVLVILFRGEWFAYPLMHGEGSGARMQMKRVCYYKWGLFPRPHEIEEVARSNE
jgi:hypothetical protein